MFYEAFSKLQFWKKLLYFAIFQSAQAAFVKFDMQILFLCWNNKPFGAVFYAAQVLCLGIKKIAFAVISAL